MIEKTVNYNKEGFENLANAIIVQAVKDYRKALSGFSSDGKSDTDVIAECERFFRSEWFSVLTNADGEYLITNIRKESGFSLILNSRPLVGRVNQNKGAKQMKTGRRWAK